MNGRFAPLQQGVLLVEQLELEAVVRNLDGRVARIEQILPTLVRARKYPALLLTRSSGSPPFAKTRHRDEYRPVAPSVLTSSIFGREPNLR
jgi:hypothetical protein